MAGSGGGALFDTVPGAPLLGDEAEGEDGDALVRGADVVTGAGTGWQPAMMSKVASQWREVRMWGRICCVITRSGSDARHDRDRTSRFH